MAGKLLGTLIILLFLTFIILLVTTYFLHQTIDINVNAINYNVIEAVATSGRFTRDLYDYLQDNAGKYGHFYIKLKLEKQIKPGVYDTYFDNSDIIDKYLRVGDRLTIYLEDRDQTLFGRLINASFLGYRNDRILDMRIKSMKTAVIAKEAKNLVKGYDVIADIKSWGDRTYLSGDGHVVSIMVKTKLSTAGKVYSSVSNPVYGDSADETGNTGENYIFDNGDFLKEEVENTQGGTKQLEITYVQQ